LVQTIELIAMFGRTSSFGWGLALSHFLVLSAHSFKVCPALIERHGNAMKPLLYSNRPGLRRSRTTPSGSSIVATITLLFFYLNSGYQDCPSGHPTRPDQRRMACPESVNPFSASLVTTEMASWAEANDVSEPSAGFGPFRADKPPT
jgi:hypothetical protein